MPLSISNNKSSDAERKMRARKIISRLKKLYPEVTSELNYKTPFQFVVAVMLSAQCTDKAVNKTTESLFKTYRTPKDFADSDPQILESELSSIPFFRNKARHIRATALILVDQYKSKVPNTEKDLILLPGIAYKTAHVVLGELYEIWEGIPSDTHVKRFAKRFDLVDSDDLTKISKELERLIPKKDWKYVNNGLVLYGRYICPARPHDCIGHALTKIWPASSTRWPKAS